jgi:hypothetical protein
MMLSLRSPSDRRFLLILACWALVFYWHFVRDREQAPVALPEPTSASTLRSRHAEAAAAAAARAQALPPLPSRLPSYPAPAAPAAPAAPPYPGTPDGLQLHGAFSVSPSWPLREFRCPVPVVLPSEVERYKRISGLYRNLTSTLPFYVRGWAAAKAGGATGGGDAVTDGAARAAGVAAMSMLRVQSMEVQRFVGMQEDVLERFGVAMQ